MTLLRYTAAAAFCLVVAWSSASAAAAGERPALIMLVPKVQDASVSAAAEAISSQISDLEADLAVTPVDALPTSFDAALATARSHARPSGVTAIFWVIETEDDAALLYLFEGDGARALVRRVEGPGGPARLEALSVIVRMSIAELLRGGRIGVAVETEAAAPAPAPVERRAAPTPEEPRRGWLRPGVAYALAMASEEHPVVQGLDVALGASPLQHLWVLAGYTFFERIESSGADASISVARHPLRLGVRGAERWSALELGLSLSFVADWTTFRLKTGSDLHPVGGQDDFVWGLLPAIDFGVSFTRWLVVFASFGAEIDLPSLSYAYEKDGARVVLLDTWKAQPRLLVGLAVDVP